MASIRVFRAAKAEDKKFQLAIGKLVLAFSDLEVMLCNLLKHYGNISNDVGRAIFSGARPEVLIANIRAVAHNVKLKESDPDRFTDLDEILIQVSHLNSMRNFIIHHVDGFAQNFDSKDPSTRLLSDRQRVRKHGSAKWTKIGSAHINAMSEDATTCCWRMQCHTNDSNNPFLIPQIDFRTNKPFAWLYKPLELKTLNPQTHSADHKQRRPRKS